MEKEKHLSLYELQSLIKQRIDAAHPMPYWVVAEISEIKVNYSGHCYLELVEKGGSNQVPRAKVSAVIWRNQYTMISSYFKTETGSDLKSGLKILVKVVVNYHELYGLSFQITDIEPSFTLGDMERQRRETIERLTREGIFDMNHEMELPVVIQNIAVVSSRNAAGFQDFMNELEANEYGYCYNVALFDSFMQGNETENSVVEALDLIAENLDSYDVVVVIRGGGSQSDLAAFDSYKLCSHLAQFPLPIITGIGHDKDTSVADMIANVHLKTPTAVAGFLIDYNAEFEGEINEYGSQIERLVSEKLRIQRERTSQYSYQLGVITTTFIHSVSKRLDEYYSVAIHNAKMRIESERSRINLLSTNICSTPQNRISVLNHNLSSIETQINQSLSQFIASKKRELTLISDVIESKRPERIFKMGYSLIRSTKGTVKSINDVAVGEIIDIQVSDGTIRSEIKSKNR